MKAHQKKSDKSDSQNSAAVHQEGQVACSTQKLLDISPEQEQLFQRTFKDPCLIQWLKMRQLAEYAGVTADHDPGLEHWTNITPCIIANGNRSQSSANELSFCQESQLNFSVLQGGCNTSWAWWRVELHQKYLIQYFPTKKTVNNGKHATGVRVLTSDECPKIIFERKEKKERNKRRKKQGKLKESLRKRKEKKLLRRKWRR